MNVCANIMYWCLVSIGLLWNFNIYKFIFAVQCEQISECQDMPTLMALYYDLSIPEKAKYHKEVLNRQLEFKPTFVSNLWLFSITLFSHTYVHFMLTIYICEGSRFNLAVRGGFEPPEQFPVRQFSKLVVSATHPPHRLGVQIYALSHFFQAV